MRSGSPGAARAAVVARAPAPAGARVDGRSADVRPSLGLLVVALLGGCPSTSACPPGTVAASGGCVAFDAGVDAPPGPVDAAADGGPELRDGGVDACTGAIFYADMDDDGHGDPAVTQSACSAPRGYVAAGDDCDDGDPLRFPGNAEACDGLDNDCDAPMADEDFACVRGAVATCTTGCGTAGTGTCTSACALPVGDACVPPVEVCDGTDQDCDELVDEGLGGFGPRRELGTTSGRTVVIRTTTSFAVITHRIGAGLVGQRFDAAGAPLGGEVVLTPTATDDFDAWPVDGRIALGWHDRSNFYLANVPETLGAATGVNVGVSDAFYGRVQVVATASAALLVYFDGNVSRLMAIRRSFPSFSGSAAPFEVAAMVRGSFDVALESTGTRAFAAFVNATDDVTVAGLLMSGSRESVAAISFGTANPQRAPAIAFGVAPGSASRLAIAYHENPVSGDRVVLRSVNVTGATLTLQDTVTVFTGAPPDPPAEPISVTHAGGRWFVSALLGSMATTSSWRFGEVRERVGAPPAVVGGSVETESSANFAPSIAAGPSTGGSSAILLTAAGRSDGVGRAYRWGCP